MKIPIGLDADSREIRLIDEVPSGLKCNCICPECDSPLIAKKGPIKADHFSHYKTTEQRACQETAIHLMAKHLLKHSSRIRFPSYKPSQKTVYSILQEPLSADLSFFNAPIPVTDVEEEVYLTDYRIKPDILCSTDIKGLPQQIAIEVKVTHEVDENKEKKIHAADLTTVEIDLSDLIHLSEISFDDIKTALQEPERLVWIKRSSRLQSHLKSLSDEQTDTIRRNRDEEIQSWLLEVEKFLSTKGHIQLPRYQLPKSITAPSEKDWLGKNIKLSIPKIPTLPRNLSISGQVSLQKAILKVGCSEGRSRFPLYILVQLPGTKVTPPDGSHLLLNIEKLPHPETVEELLSWGISKKMEDYKTEVRAIKYNALTAANKEIKLDIEYRMVWLKSIRDGTLEPDFKHLDRIQHDYHNTLNELNSKGIPVGQWTKAYRDGWIFGCPSEYWQTILIRMICFINNDGVNVEYYAKELRKHHFIDVIEPVRTLTFNKRAVSKANFNPASIPSTYKMLWDYFEHLEQMKVLKKWGRGKFVKQIPFGTAYRQL